LSSVGHDIFARVASLKRWEAFLSRFGREKNVGQHGAVRQFAEQMGSDGVSVFDGSGPVKRPHPGPAVVLPLMMLLASAAHSAEVLIEVFPTQQFQTISGFGAALTESSAWLLRNELSYEERTNLLAELFDPEQGIGLSMIRHPMGSSDFRLEDYTYDDMPPGQTDFGLTNFNVSRDELWIIPTLQEILSINPEVRIVGSPWSPPAWMKTNDELYGGRLRTDAYDALARYFVKYVQAYTNHSLPVYAVTLQNEPLFEPADYPGMYLAATGEIRLATLVGGYFQSNGIGTEIWIYDHNWDSYAYADDVLDDPVARQYVAASAFHGYAGDVLAQSLLHEAHPDKAIQFTELSAGAWSGGFASVLEYDALNLLVGVTRNWGSSILKWNLILDQDYGPKTNGGCQDCTGILTLDTTTGQITRNADYYTLGHIARFVRPGAVRIGVSESTPSPVATAFRNADSNLVLIAYNDSDEERNFVIRWQDQSCSYPLPGRTLATFCWANRAGATVDVWLTSADQTRLLVRETNCPVFVPRRINWCGWTWTVQDNYGEPGENYYSAANVRLDSSNRLHLAVTEREGLVYAAALRSEQSGGFGTYRWYLATNPDELDTNLVSLLRTDFDASHELDIRVTRGLEDPETNLHFIVQPEYEEGHGARFAATFTGSQITAEFTWTPRRVRFRTWYGHAAAPVDTSAVIASWTYEGEDVPGDTNEWVNMALWPYAGLTPTAAAELVIAGFDYVAATGALLYDDFEDGVLSTQWVKFADAESGVVESGGCLEVTPADSDDHNRGVTSAFPLHWEDDGISYSFRATLSSVAVSRSTAAGGADIFALHGILSTEAGNTSLYHAAAAAYIRAGFDADADSLQVDFLTKTNAPDSWGELRFSAVISNAAALLAPGCELVFTLTYHQYQVEAFSGGSPVGWSVLSGSSTGLHGLGNALYDCRYQLGAANRGDGRGMVRWAETRVARYASLPSAAASAGDGEPAEKQVQIGEVNGDQTWASPLDSRYPKHRTMVLYHADDIGRGGTVTQLYLYVFNPPPLPLENYCIRVQQTSLEELPDNFINDGWQTVYSNTLTVPADFSGWLALPLDSSFDVSAESNLLIDFSFDQTAYDAGVMPAAAYAASSYTSVRSASGSRDSPQTWITWPRGRKFRYSGPRLVTVRLEFENAYTPLAGNLSFEDGPPGFLTNVPSWRIVGSPYAGAIKSSPALHLNQSLKLWKADTGDGSQRLVQGIAADPSQEYTLDGYIMSQSGEPFGGQDTYAALVLEWYNSAGQLLSSAESAHYVPDSQYDIWLHYEVSSVPPPNAASGQIVCLLSSSPSQYGSVFFDKLGLTSADAPPSSNQVPESHEVFLRDLFDDGEMSNIWTYVGNWDGASFSESNGCFWVTPGTSYYQSSGYVTVEPLTWSDTDGWYVFSAVLTTIALARTQSGYDGEALLGICSEPDNPWWVTNSCGLYGYYDQEGDLLTFVFYTKTDSPTNLGVERCRVDLHPVSAYLNETNSLRINIALGEYQYELSFLDLTGEPVPLDLVGGRLRGQHYLADRLYEAYWLVGAQSDLYNRPTPAWDETRVLHTRAPELAWVGAAQISTNGAGLLSLTSRVTDVNGDICLLSLEVSTNGTDWSAPAIAAVTGLLPAASAVRSDLVQAASICTTDGLGRVAANTLSLTWDTLSADNALALENRTATGVWLRLRSFDGYVSSMMLTVFPLVVDNEGPDAENAWVKAAGGAEYTFSVDFPVEWGGFSDRITGIRGYYYHTEGDRYSPACRWTTAPPVTVTAEVADAVCTVYVWAVDEYGNVGPDAQDGIAVLSSGGDYDADGLANDTEESYHCSPVSADTDGDGMFDGWEISFGLEPTNAADGDADDDADGYANRGEFYADTDPHDAASHQWFGALRWNPGEFVLHWNSSTGRAYTVLSATSPASSWSVVSGWQSVPGSGGEMLCTSDVSETGCAYYRLKVTLP